MLQFSSLSFLIARLVLSVFKVKVPRILTATVGRDVGILLCCVHSFGFYILLYCVHSFVFVFYCAVFIPLFLYFIVLCSFLCFCILLCCVHSFVFVP